MSGQIEIIFYGQKKIKYFLTLTNLQYIILDIYIQ
jgi:hypothetical protein